jgi:hypothetical protein
MFFALKDFVLSALELSALELSALELNAFVCSAFELTAFSPSTGVLAILAFLVVFNALINDFFWMDMLGSSIFCLPASRLTTYLNAGGVPKKRATLHRNPVFRISNLQDAGPGLTHRPLVKECTPVKN